MQTRREFGKMALASLPIAGLAMSAGIKSAKAAPDQLRSEVAGVRLGIITGSLGGVGGVGRGTGTGATQSTPSAQDPVDAMVAACLVVGFTNIEYTGPGGAPTVVDAVIGQVPPKITPAYANSREALRQWRINAPLDPYYAAQKKFKDAGLNWFSMVNTVSDDSTDAEIDAMFRQMKATGVDRFCTNQTRVSQGPRLVEFADRYGVQPAWHTHDKSEDPDEVASRESLEKLMAMAPRFWINLDIGHYTAGNQDAVAFIKDHHDRISHLHVKDRKKDHGPNVAWGTGDTPIVECLRLIRDNKYPIIVLIEREYHGPNDGTPVEETRKDMDYMIKALES